MFGFAYKMKFLSKIKEWFKYLKSYLKYHEEINDYYSFSLKGKYGEQVPEDYGWWERTNYWYHTMN